MPLSVNASTHPDPFLFDFEADPGPEPQKPINMQHFNNGNMNEDNSSHHFVKDENNNPNFNFMQSNSQAFNNGSFGAPAYGSINPSVLSGAWGVDSSSYVDDDILNSLGPSGDDNFVAAMQSNHIGYGDYDAMLASSLQGQHGIPPNHNISQMVSHTPDGAPMHSPFARNFQNGMQFRNIQAPQGHMGSPSSFNPSPIGMSDNSMGDFADPKMKRKTRPEIPRVASSKSQIPQTPTTPGLNNLSLETFSSSMPAQTIQNPQLGHHRKQQSLSENWNNSPNSLSFVDSPLSSPGPGAGHMQISDIFKSGKGASLPAKVEGGPGLGPAQQSQEAKRRRRRESHNLVERRRRDNINERIQELSFLVPQHRLEDEKVRKYLQNNTPLSPSLHGVSPPRAATSGLAGGMGRRASGVSTAPFLPIEDKDKGPNKGDILNGAVGWTRDLMWALYTKIKQEKDMQERLERAGQPFPIHKTEDDKRMEAELITAIENNQSEHFQYSRGPGSGLRVPGFTDYAGAPSNGVDADERGFPQSQPFWHMKEEPEYDMDES